jgi:hypothetical protein
MQEWVAEGGPCGGQTFQLELREGEDFRWRDAQGVEHVYRPQWVPVGTLWRRPAQRLQYLGTAPPAMPPAD